MQRREDLIKALAEEYGEKLFYFCLKKTGDGYEAEDLCSEILLCVLEALGKGTVPEDFPAYVWQVARNRYARWADLKRKSRDTMAGTDIADYEIEDENAVTENELIRREQIALLRRELAFISSDYRNILIAYYLENKSIRDIVRTTGLPKGTVESKLHRGRKRLKEGMNMAREFGVRSYQPEEITLINNCTAFGDNGQPWSILNHGMYKNILLEAYNNPSTAEELALELGIALPYMEEELEYLVKETLLVKNKDKYETDFPIISREAQEKLTEKNAALTAEITSLLEKLLDTFHDACGKAGVNYFGGYIPYEDAKWSLLMIAFDHYRWYERPRCEYRDRPNNGKWEVVGCQTTRIPHLPFVGQHGCFSTREDLPGIAFHQFKFMHGDIYSRTPEYLSHEEGYVLKLVAEGKWQECNKAILEKLAGYGYVRAEGDGYLPNVLVFNGHGCGKYWDLLDKEAQEEVDRLSTQLKASFGELAAYSDRVIKKDLPARFREDKNLFELVCGSTGFDRSDVLEQAIKDGWLKDDENTGKTVGAHLYL